MQFDPTQASPVYGAMILGLVGLLVTALGLFSLDNVRDARGWEATTGTVVKSQVDADFVGDDAKVVADVEYEYTVKGIQHRGSDVHATDGTWVGCNNPAIAHQTAANYPMGARVDVYYDPADPDRSLLDRSAGTAGLYTLMGLLLMAGAGALFAMLSRNQTPPPVEW